MNVQKIVLLALMRALGVLAAAEVLVDDEDMKRAIWTGKDQISNCIRQLKIIIERGRRREENVRNGALR